MKKIYGVMAVCAFAALFVAIITQQAYAYISSYNIAETVIPFELILPMPMGERTTPESLQVEEPEELLHEESEAINELE